MPNNTLLNHFFGKDADFDPENRFDLNRRSRTRRLREMYAILNKHHFLKGFAPEQFRELLEDLGPSFIKIGQTLSTRSEILPRAYCEELSKLQMHCDPMPFDTLLEALRSYYEVELETLFAEIDPNPLGSASLAQVHKAWLKSGEVVAVKVQRPGVREKMAQDIDIMRMMARRASFVMKDNQMVNLRDVVEEMWQTFLDETDFQKEAANLARFAKLNENVKFIACPKPYQELCNNNVLVMEYIDGISIKDTERLKAAGYDLNEIGEKMLDNYATQVLDHGFFHADPHPGNIFVKDGRIVYIDLGIMGHFSARDRAGFGAIIEAVGKQNASQLKDALLAFAIQKDSANIDHSAFLSSIDSLLDDYGTCDVSELDIGAMLTDILQMTKACKVTLPSSITAVTRGIVTLEGTLTAFVGNFNVVDIINAHIMRNKDALEEIKDSIKELGFAVDAANRGAAKAAEYSGDAMRMLSRGQLKLNVEVLGSEKPLASLARIVNRLTIGIIVAGLFVGSSLMSQSAMEPRFLGVPVLAFFGYLGAFVLSAWVIVDIARRPRN